MSFGLVYAYLQIATNTPRRPEPKPPMDVMTTKEHRLIQAKPLTLEANHHDGTRKSWRLFEGCFLQTPRYANEKLKTQPNNLRRTSKDSF